MRPTGHMRERSPGSWELRYSLGTDPATGKRRVATTTVEGNRKDAEKELRRLLRTVDTGEHVDPTRMTLREWLATWLAAVRDEVSPKTHERYSEIVRNFLAPELGAFRSARLAPAHIQTAYAKWAVGGRHDGKAGGLSPQTRRHIHRILRTALFRAVEQQVIARNPADAFRKRLPKVERRTLATLNAEQSARLLKPIAHSRVYWPVLLALSTGMRRGEVLAARWKNVDLDHGILRVMESLEQTKAGIRFKPPKSGSAPRHRPARLCRRRFAPAQASAGRGIACAGCSANRRNPSVRAGRRRASPAAEPHLRVRPLHGSHEGFAASPVP